MNNKYYHIKSFDDFEKEELYLKKKIFKLNQRMELRKMDIEAYLNPVNYAITIASNVSGAIIKNATRRLFEYVFKRKKKVKKISKT